MKITMTPPLRNEFERARTCETYKARLMDLFGSEARIQQADIEWQRTKPPIHHLVIE